MPFDQIIAVAARVLEQDQHVGEQARLRPYDITAVSQDAGIIEALADTILLYALRRNDPFFTNLLDFFVRHFPPASGRNQHGRRRSSSLSASPPAFPEARRNFVNSLAPYCVLSYLLQLKDRHNASFLVDGRGHLIHIDYG